MPTPLSIFISYAHADEADKDRLLSELSIFQRNGLIKAWDDRQIDGGDEWRTEIVQAMDRCDLALLLVSRHFLDSEFIQSVELGHLLGRRKTDRIRVVSLILAPCQWTSVNGIGELQALPRDAKPLKSFSEELGQRDEAWVGIGQQIAKWAHSFMEGQTPPAMGSPLPPLVPLVSALPATPTHGSNPYDPWQAATPPRFFGRADELQTLHRALDEGRSMSVIGERRIGKSSLLRTWQAKVAGMHRKVCFLSGQGPELASCTAFVAAVMVTETIQAGNTVASPEQIADHAANMLADWRKTHAPMPPLILIDEADPLPQKLPHRFFERLRNLVENRLLCLVFASHEDINEVYQKTGRTSPLINLLEARQLGLLTLEAARMMIGLGGFDDHKRALMRRLAGTHPYYLALLGRRLWDMGDMADTAPALAQFQYEAEKRLAELWAHLSAGEQTALVQIAQGEVPPSNKRLERLKMKGLLLDNGRLFGEVLAEWLRDRE